MLWSVLIDQELEHMVELLQQRCSKLEGSHGQSSETAQTSPFTDFSQSTLPVSSSNHEGASSSPLIQGTQTDHPNAAHIMEYWIIYTVKCESMYKILHVATLGLQISRIKDNPGAADPSFQAILFAIYLAALTSIEPEEVMSRFADLKEILMARYQKALHTRIVQLDAAGKSSIELVQSMLIYMVRSTIEHVCFEPRI